MECVRWCHGCIAELLWIQYVCIVYLLSNCYGFIANLLRSYYGCTNDLLRSCCVTEFVVWFTMHLIFVAAALLRIYCWITMNLILIYYVFARDLICTCNVLATDLLWWSEERALLYLIVDLRATRKLTTHCHAGFPFGQPRLNNQQYCSRTAASLQFS